MSEQTSRVATVENLPEVSMQEVPTIDDIAAGA